MADRLVEIIDAALDVNLPHDYNKKAIAAAIRREFCVRDEHTYDGHDWCLRCDRDKEEA